MASAENITNILAVAALVGVGLTYAFSRNTSDDRIGRQMKAEREAERTSGISKTAKAITAQPS